MREDGAAPAVADVLSCGRPKVGDVSRPEAFVSALDERLEAPL